LSPAERDEAVDQLIGLVGAVDGICRTQAAADGEYFVQIAAGPFDAAQVAAIHAALLDAYRWQYIASGAQSPRFVEILGSMIDARQGGRITAALAPFVACATA
jgi:hypothetical protein